MRFLVLDSPDGWKHLIKEFSNNFSAEEGFSKFLSPILLCLKDGDEEVHSLCDQFTELVQRDGSLFSHIYAIVMEEAKAFFKQGGTRAAFAGNQWVFTLFYLFEKVKEAPQGYFPKFTPADLEEAHHASSGELI